MLIKGTNFSVKAPIRSLPLPPNRRRAGLPDSPALHLGPLKPLEFLVDGPQLLPPVVGQRQPDDQVDGQKEEQVARQPGGAQGDPAVDSRRADDRGGAAAAVQGGLPGQAPALDFKKDRDGGADGPQQPGGEQLQPHGGQQVAPEGRQQFGGHRPVLPHPQGDEVADGGGGADAPAKADDGPTGRFFCAVHRQALLSLTGPAAL